MYKMPTWAALALSVVAGALMAIQSRANGELAHRLGDAFTGSALSFGIGLLPLLIAITVWKPGRVGVVRIVRAVRTHAMPWWMVCGGLVGASFVISQSLVVATLGVALFTVATVGGQTVGGAFMDKTRVVPGGPHALTPPRVIGALLAVLAVGVTQSTGLRSDVPLWMLLLPVLVGFAQGWQQAVNARVRVVSESAFTATFLNFTTGLVLLFTTAAIQGIVVGFPEEFPTEWWLYTGGVVGIVFAGLAPIAVHAVGALLYTLAAIAGQLGTALLLDVLRPDATPLPATTILGVILALLAVVVGSIRKRPPFMRRTRRTDG